VLFSYQNKRQKWDQNVDQLKGSCFCYEAWKMIIENSYGVRLHFSEINDNQGKLVGLVLYYRSNNGTPFIVRKGVLSADGYVLEDVVREFIEVNENAQKSGLTVEKLKITFKTTLIIDLAGGIDVAWKKLRGETRTDIRKGIKKGLQASTGWDYFDEFYEIYKENMLYNGAVIHSKKFFEEVRDCLQERASLHVVLVNRKVVAGLVVLWSKEVADIYLGAWDRDFTKFSPNSFNYWKVIELAAEKGVLTVDMGQSTVGSGTYRYKTNFGGKPHQETVFEFKTHHSGSDGSEQKGPHSLILRARRVVITLLKTIENKWLYRQMMVWWLMRQRALGRII